MPSHGSSYFSVCSPSLFFPAVFLPFGECPPAPTRPRHHYCSGAPTQKERGLGRKKKMKKKAEKEKRRHSSETSGGPVQLSKVAVRSSVLDTASVHMYIYTPFCFCDVTVYIYTTLEIMMVCSLPCYSRALTPLPLPLSLPLSLPLPLPLPSPPSLSLSTVHTESRGKGGGAREERGEGPRGEGGGV